MTELAEVFRLHGPAYREKFAGRMPERHLRAMAAIESCRTPARGGQLYLCEGCGDFRFSYHSCRNRHCPKCQGEEAARWLQRRQDLLLPAPTFLVTFTVPEELRALVRSRPRALLDVLFRSSSAALRQLARNPRFLGGEIGCLGVLHTWARSLVYHPHIHYVVPGGALAGDSWRTVPRPGFLVPVQALSAVFRAKFRDAVRELDRTEGTDHFSKVPAGTWRRPWVVHCKPVGDGLGALKYLARYVFRVALSQNRVVCVESGVVTFRYKDSETGRHCTCRLPAEEFIRRFLQHVLPHRFVKVCAPTACSPAPAVPAWPGPGCSQRAGRAEPVRRWRRRRSRPLVLWTSARSATRRCASSARFARGGRDGGERTLPAVSRSPPYPRTPSSPGRGGRARSAPPAPSRRQ